MFLKQIFRFEGKYASFKNIKFPRGNYQTDVHFGIISKSFHQRSACFAVHLTLWCKKHDLKHFCDLFEIKHTEIFYSCIFDLQYNILSTIGITFFVWNLIRMKFTFYWSFVVFRLSLPWKYRFPYFYITSNFNLRPVTGVNVTSIRVWEVC